MGQLDITLFCSLITFRAIGISVPGISLASKSVTLKGFNGLKDGVKINTFDLPSDDPAGGIHLTLDADTINASLLSDSPFSAMNSSLPS